MNIEKKPRKHRTLQERIADFQAKAAALADKAALKAAEEAAKNDPTVKHLHQCLLALNKAKVELKYDRDGYANVKTGGWYREPLSLRLAKIEAKAERMRARLDRLDSLPTEVDASIARVQSLISRRIAGEFIEVPSDVLPDVLRESSAVEPETAFIASEQE